ncbi:MAG: hypothetical protein PWP14_231 [Methanolobus sp.]|nr:hypothetical protein [Methanolobus sp.]
MGTRRSSSSVESSPFAQIYTLEALMALLLIIGVIVFTVQATSLTPLTSSTANAHIEAQLQILGQDMLNSLDYAEYGQDSLLKKDVLSWNGTYYTWDSQNYRAKNGNVLISSSTAELLEAIAVKKGIAHNVEFSWIEGNGRVKTMPYIYNGEPSDNAVIITKRVLLSDSDFPSAIIQDSDTATDFYNVIDVKLTLWRM